ncbi:MarR family transcriptional regulator [Youhaiella tibetensis]|uniref:Winged helix-turn-helix transcriptional regulator n=1 Tax=Paradevosia tibetensis TaxID=1447062 RepID=A0A5B9DN60_9HYPH|nr:MarR family winged helix-turn-helix transcriptional regulator [Youhaiella tibetensis]AKR54778.1 MarR family transcriptional regulator [Devosia sp. H5989]QEE19898.1 winged helix-turn-helix transcriptional regulator [Youhaiella tibetensis]GGF28874.1 MarR family transcriptional regulator [Youhaiella tibetensis]
MTDFANLLRDFTADIAVSHRLWKKMSRHVVVTHGVTEAQAIPLVWISRMGENVHQNVLADRCGIEGASLVRLLDDLQKAGFVTRTPDPDDRRANLLRLTERGKTAARNIETDMDRFREDLLAKADPADIEAAMRVFALIKAASEAGKSLDPAA